MEMDNVVNCDDAKLLMKDAKSLEKLQEGLNKKVKLGRPPLKEKKQSFTLRLPIVHVLEFKGYCARKGKTCSSVIDTLMVEYLKINGIEIG